MDVGPKPSNDDAASAPWRAEALRAHLTTLIGSGAFASRAELNAYIATLGLGQVRNGVDHVTVACAGERVRLYLGGALLRQVHELTVRERRRDGAASYAPEAGREAGVRCCVYLIVAVDAQREAAAYVGSTSRLHHRLAAHFHGRDGASADLMAWAHRHRAQVHASAILCTNTRSGAFQLEGFITRELERRGWLLPGVSRWGAARRAAPVVGKSLRQSNISWSEPSLDDVRQWPRLSHYKFYA